MVNKIKIIGERCSGTNYLQQLILKNFNIEIIQDTLPPSKNNHKHFTLDFNQYDDDTLIIVIIRNPYDWIRSLYAYPHHMHKLRNRPFNRFLNNKAISYGGPYWGLWYNGNGDMRPEHMIEDYKNIFELRKYKIEKYLQSDFPNLEIISYDKLIDNLEILSSIAKKYNITLCHESIKNISGYVGNGKDHQFPKKYPMIDPKSLAVINKNLDWELESKVGFSPDDYLKNTKFE